MIRIFIVKLLVIVLLLLVILDLSRGEPDCVLSQWSSWGSCSQPCGPSGLSKRTRSKIKGDQDDCKGLFSFILYFLTIPVLVFRVLPLSLYQGLVTPGLPWSFVFLGLPHPRGPVLYKLKISSRVGLNQK